MLGTEETVLRFRKFRHFGLPVSLAVTVLLVVALPGSVMAESVSTAAVPIPQSTFNPCNGDFVSGVGHVNAVITSNVSASGNTNLNIHTEEWFSGTGVPSGSNYISSTTDD